MTALWFDVRVHDRCRILSQPLPLQSGSLILLLHLIHTAIFFWLNSTDITSACEAEIIILFYFLTLIFFRITVASCGLWSSAVWRRCVWATTPRLRSGEEDSPSPWQQCSTMQVAIHGAESRSPKRRKHWDGCRGWDDCRRRQLAYNVAYTWSGIGKYMESNRLLRSYCIHGSWWFTRSIVTLLLCCASYSFINAAGCCSFSPSGFQDIASYSASDLISPERWGHAEQMLLEHLW